MNILILKEKHGERYFTYNTAEERHLIARFIVSERMEEGYYEDEQNKSVLANLKKVLLDGDGKAAFQVLDARSRGEYEGFEIVTAEEVMFDVVLPRVVT